MVLPSHQLARHFALTNCNISMASSFAAHHRRRVSEDAPSREERLARGYALYSSSDDEEAEEQERLLTEQHGEAAETTVAGTKREQTDKEIEAEYSTRKRRKPRPTLKPSHLMGANGLIGIPLNFRDIHFPKRANSIDAAAQYSRSLVHAYKTFCFDLFPGLAFEDVLSRIETFGSKREVKSYLNQMRDSARNTYLEKIYGKDTAEKMTQELEHGIRLHQHGYPMDEDVEESELELIDKIDHVLEHRTVEEPDSNEQPPPGNSEATVSLPLPSTPVADKMTTGNDSDSDDEIQWGAATVVKEKTQVSGSALVDTSDEEDDGKEDEEEDRIDKAETSEIREDAGIYGTSENNPAEAHDASDKGDGTGRSEIGHDGGSSGLLENEQRQKDDSREAPTEADSEVST